MSRRLWQCLAKPYPAWRPPSIYGISIRTVCSCPFMGRLDRIRRSCSQHPSFSSRDGHAERITKYTSSAPPSHAPMTHITNPTSLDTMFDMLGDAYRRRILLAVATHNPQTETAFPPEPFSPDNTDETEDDQVKIERVHTHTCRNWPTRDTSIGIRQPRRFDGGPTSRRSPHYSN